MTSQLTDLRNLVSQKEKEWKDAVDRRLVQLEEDLAAKTSLLEDRQTKLQRLKEDFKYNVQLLKDRDREITRLEAEISEARQRAHAADLATSESAVALDEARAAILSLRDDKVALVEEMDRQSAGQVSATERVRRDLELQLERQRTAAAERERHLELEAVRLREAAEAQRREMLAAMETALAAREAEGREAAAEATKRALAADLRAQLLERELEACREARAAAMREAADGEARRQEVAAEGAEAALRLESEAALLRAALERQQEAARRQAEQFERALGERTAAAKEVAELLAAERREGRQKLAEACETFEAAQFEFGQVEWRLKEEQKQLQLRLEAAHEELAALRERAEAAERRAEAARGDQASELRSLRAEAAGRREEAVKCRQELAATLERQRRAEAAAAQAEVDATAQAEAAVEAERERLDSLVTNLVAKTSELNAQLEAAREALAQKELLLQGLIHERDLALQALQDNGLPFNRRAELRVPLELQHQLRSMQGENAQLRAELERRKEEKQQQQEENKEEMPLTMEPPLQLSNAPNVSRLRQERIQLIAQCRKQASRIQHLEGQLESLQNELRDHLTQIDKLEYEVSAGARHHSAELHAARQRVTDLEGQLAESRREADEYYKGNLEQTRLNEELERRLALASGGKKAVKATPSLQFGAQELLIQQLQDEVESLQQRLRAELDEQAATARGGGGGGGGGGEDEARLRAKLRLAAQKLMRLAEENAVLREASSHLRAALLKAGVPVPAAATAANRARHPRPRLLPPGSGDGSSRLREVQGIEYALVRQRMSARTHSPPERLPVPAPAPAPVPAPAPAPAEQPKPQPRRPELIDSGDGSLAELWQQLGDCELSSSASEQRTF